VTSSVATSTKTKGIVSLVLGIVSVIISWLIPLVGLIAGIVGVVLGFLSRRSEPDARTLSLWGLILSFAGIVLSVVFWILTAIIVVQAVQNGS
jgi:hypothetical protein